MYTVHVQRTTQVKGQSELAWRIWKTAVMVSVTGLEEGSEQ